MKNKIHNQIHKKIMVDEIMSQVTLLHKCTFEAPDLYSVWDGSGTNNELFIRHYIHRYKLLYQMTNEMHEYISNSKNKDDVNYNKKTLKLLQSHLKTLQKMLINGNKKGKTEIERQGINKYFLIFCAKKIDK